jgi:hypothetical protein
VITLISTTLTYGFNCDGCGVERRVDAPDRVMAFNVIRKFGWFAFDTHKSAIAFCSTCFALGQPRVDPA